MENPLLIFHDINISTYAMGSHSFATHDMELPSHIMEFSSFDTHDVNDSANIMEVSNATLILSGPN